MDTVVTFKMLLLFKKKTHKVHMNNGPTKALKKICFWDQKFEKQTKIATHMDL